MTVDFHTHSRRAQSWELRSVSPEAFVPGEENQSLEFHPWRLPSAFAGLPPEFLKLLPECAAVGEIGLDRLRGPVLNVQIEYLRELLKAAKTYQKPLVFHCVRAHAELLTECRDYSGQNKLLHGFRGKLPLLKEYLRHGFFVSMTPAHLATPGIADFCHEHLDCIGFESDDGSALDGQAIADALHIKIADFEQIQIRTFQSFLNRQ